MSIGSASNRSCDASGRPREPPSKPRWPNAMNGWMSLPLCIHKAGRRVGCCCPRSALRSSLSRLSAFAEEVGAGPDKQIVLVLDRAGWHSSARLILPEGIHLVFLPPYSPEVQQAPRLWPLSNEPLANRVFTSLDELEEVQAARCRWLQAHPEIVQAHTCFRWSPMLSEIAVRLPAAACGTPFQQLIAPVTATLISGPPTRQ